ncbi:hypothetical protein IAT38_005712 [Cryptococcus sp. DSM 104549]
MPPPPATDPKDFPIVSILWNLDGDGLPMLPPRPTLCRQDSTDNTLSPVSVNEAVNFALNELDFPAESCAAFEDVLAKAQKMDSRISRALVKGFFRRREKEEKKRLGEYKTKGARKKRGADDFSGGAGGSRKKFKGEAEGVEEEDIVDHTGDGEWLLRTRHRPSFRRLALK